MKSQTERHWLVLTAQRHQTVQIFAHLSQCDRCYSYSNPGWGEERNSRKNELVSSPIAEEESPQEILYIYIYMSGLAIHQA